LMWNFSSAFCSRNSLNLAYILRLQREITFYTNKKAEVKLQSRTF
jgi:hypothetical protein